MPYGFIGNGARKYLSDVSNSMSTADEANSSVTAGCSIDTGSHQSPYSPSSAMSGGYATGIGNQSNIVVDSSSYDTIVRKIRMTDEMTARDLYNIAVQIEEMCSTVYIVPQTLTKYLSILGLIKTSLGEFVSLTEEIGIETTRFVNSIMDGDR